MNMKKIPIIGAIPPLNCEHRYIMELHQSPGIHACFELRMDASKYAPFEVRTITIVHELWLTLHCFCFASFVLIGIQFLPFQHQTGEREFLHTDTVSGKFLGRLTTETFVSFALRSHYHRNGSTYSAITCWSSVWCHDGSIGAILLGQSLRNFSAPLRGLSRSKRPNEVKTVCFTYPFHSILVSAG